MVLHYRSHGLLCERAPYEKGLFLVKSAPGTSERTRVIRVYVCVLSFLIPFFRRVIDLIQYRILVWCLAYGSRKPYGSCQALAVRLERATASGCSYLNARAHRVKAVGLYTRSERAEERAYTAYMLFLGHIGPRGHWSCSDPLFF